MPAINVQLRKQFGANSPSGEDLEKLHSIMLVNSNPAIDYAESLPPNIIQVGGLQIKEPKSLPNDINQFILKGKKGAVVMGLGTNIRSDQIGHKAIHSIIEAFRQIPDYNFIWKFETSEMIKDLPSNVMVRHWIPQSDILAHPNTKAFITHGGLLSVHESIWYGVPMLVMPMFSDQHRNSFRIVSAGIAHKIDYHTLNTDKFKRGIIEVLHSPKYRKNIQLKSKRFKDQPEKPIDRAVWWCEYVIRNPKPSHLRQAEFNFGLLGSHFWDIQMIIILMIIIVIVCFRKIFQFIFSTPNVTVNVAKTSDKKKKN